MKKKSKIYLLGVLALLIFMPNVAFAQTLTVEGTVKDEMGEPLIGLTGGAPHGQAMISCLATNFSPTMVMVLGLSKSI